MTSLVRLLEEAQGKSLYQNQKNCSLVPNLFVNDRPSSLWILQTCTGTGVTITIKTHRETNGKMYRLIIGISFPN
jgi:hypothetical protein